MRHSNLVNRLVFGLIGAIITSGAGLGGVVAALAMVRSEARAQAKEEVRESVKLVDRVDAGLKGLEARLTVVEQQVPQLRAEVYEQRLETRDLYKAVMDGKRSERLERPPTVPIGRPDGGG